MWELEGYYFISYSFENICKVLLNRIELVLDGVLREEQAGFRKGWGCSDQIFDVRHLMQHANEINANLSLCFVEFD